MNEKLRGHFLELIRRSSTDLPQDVEAALVRGRDAEAAGSSSKGVINNILENVKMAREKSTPICQDTGSLLFEVNLPRGTDERPYEEARSLLEEERRLFRALNRALRAKAHAVTVGFKDEN